MRGMIVGLLAGVIAFAFASVFGEPQVALAIAYEDQMNAAAVAGGAAEAPPAFTRATQAGIGLLTGMLAYGAAVGGMFSIVFALSYGRLGELGARSVAAVLALAAFVSTGLMPLLKYPANPPAVGFDDTIGARTSLYFILLVLSVIAMILSFLIARRIWARHGGWTASIVAGAVYLALMTVAFLALPSVREMPEGFDPQVVWNFRIAALGLHLVVWLAIGLGFGAVAQRLLEARQPKRAAALR